MIPKWHFGDFVRKGRCHNGTEWDCGKLWADEILRYAALPEVIGVRGWQSPHFCRKRRVRNGAPIDWRFDCAPTRPSTVEHFPTTLIPFREYSNDFRSRITD